LARKRDDAVDEVVADEPLADRLIEIGHLLAGIGHHERTCGGCVVGQRSGACRLIAVYDDLAALGE